MMVVGRKTKILLGAGLAVVLALALFDWNWLRGPLERYLARESKREVRIDDLHIALGPNPTIRVRGFHVQNAPWSDSKPLIAAGEASFTFSLRSLWHERTLVSRVVLIDADVNLQKQADGLRNWRLIDPDYKGPGKVKVLALEAHRSKLRLVNGAADFEVTAAASDPASAEAGRTMIEFSGSYQKVKYSGRVLTGEVLTLQDTGRSFPLAGHIQWPGTRLDIDGSMADFLRPSAIEGKLRVAGPSLASLHPFLRARPPATRPYRLEGQIRQSDTETTSILLRGRIGESDMAIDGSYSRTQPRAMLRAKLSSDAAFLADFLPAPSGTRADPGRIFSTRKFDAARLSANDAQVTLAAKRFRLTDGVVLENLRLAAALDDGVLQLKPFDFVLAGGKAAGSLTLEAHEGRITSRLAADVNDARFQKLFVETAAKSRISGPIDARIRLAGQGDSIAALFGSATGSFDAAMDQGRISNLADAKIALNGGKILALKLRGDADIGIVCAGVGIDFSHGVGRFRVLALDTEQTRTRGTGSVDLRTEKFAALLLPRPRNPGLLSLGSSIRVNGSFRHAGLSVERNKGEAAPGNGGRCGLS